MSFAQVFTIRNGQQTRMEIYADLDEALKAVGLKKQELLARAPWRLVLHGRLAQTRSVRAAHVTEHETLPQASSKRSRKCASQRKQTRC